MSLPSTTTSPGGTPGEVHPPLTPLVLNVGVTGHKIGGERPATEEVVIRKTVRSILDRIQLTVNGVAKAHPELFDPIPVSVGGPRKSLVRLFSLLAEGADLWVAQEAREAGYELQAVLPGQRAQYQAEFPPGPAGEDTFRELLGASSAVFELDRGDAGVAVGGTLPAPAETPDSARMVDPPEFYAAAARVMLNQCDVLLALWDGQEKGRGGTGYVVRKAWERGIPVVVIDWTRPDHWRFAAPQWRVTESESDLKDDWSRLRRRIEEILLPPGFLQVSARESEAPDLRARFFDETKPSTRPWPSRWFSGTAEAFARIVGLGHGSPGPTGGPVGSDEGRSPRLAPTAGAPLAAGLLAEMDRSFLRHYTWANDLSVYYGRLYRSAVVTAFLLAGMAVGFALAGFWFEQFWAHPAPTEPGLASAPPGGDPAGPGIWHRLWRPEPICVALEALTIAVIVLLTVTGKSGHWHERWMDYRTLAERLRVARVLWPIGGSRQSPTIPAHLATYGHPAATWMHWHATGIQRAAGLPNAVVNAPFLATVCEVLLRQLLDDQEQYHRRAARRLGHLDHRIHLIATALFVATGVLCVIHFLLEIIPSTPTPEPLRHLLVVASAFLPAIGAALAAIRSHSEFQRLAQRSAAMASGLGHLERDLAQIDPRDPAIAYGRIQVIAGETAQLMNNETLDWRIVFQDRPIALPA